MEYAKRLRLIGVSAGLIVGAGCIAAVVMPVLVGLFNAEFREGNSELTRLPPNGAATPQEVPLVVRVTLLGFDEATGRLNAMLFAYTRDSQLHDALQRDSLKLFVLVHDGETVDLAPDVARAQLRFPPDTLPGVGFGYAVSTPIELRPRIVTDVAVFPFDRYRARLLVSIVSRAGVPPFAVEVERSYFNRTMTVAGAADDFEITAGRSLLDRIIVLGSSGLFLIVCVLIILSLVRQRARLTGLEESLALGGFLIAAVGFREFAGFASLQSRSFLDVVVFLFPLIALLVIFASRFIRPLRSASSVSPSRGE